MHNSNDFNWHAIVVRSRCEKLAATDLEARGFEIFSALSPQRRVWVDRVRVVEMPLFPGYIFARFEAKRQRTQVEQAVGVASVVRCGNDEAPVPDREIESIKAVLRSGWAVASSPFLRVGYRVRVCYGPFAGVVGILERVKNCHRLIVSISLLQRSVAVEVEESLVESLEPLRLPAWPEGRVVTSEKTHI